MKRKLEGLKQIGKKITGKEIEKMTLGGVIAEIAESFTGLANGKSTLPKLFLNGDTTGISKNNAVNMKVLFTSSQQEFIDICTLKWQGTSSLNYPKKNFTIKFENKIDVGYGKEKKYCLKANFIDHSHARNIVSARIWSDIVNQRENVIEELKNTQNMGAIDGFPCKLYLNGKYEGLYTFNIPKDPWMFGMNEENEKNCVLCGENYESGCFRAGAVIDGTDWSDEIHEEVPNNILTRWNEIITFVRSSTDEEFREGLNNYIDVESLIDYYIYAYFSCGLDSMGKNQIYLTYNGEKWYASMYDMDSTWGLYWDGSKFVSNEYRCQEDYESMKNGRSGNLLYQRLKEIFSLEIGERYKVLRENALSTENIIIRFEDFIDLISKELYEEDLTIYTTIPSGGTNNIQQIRGYITERAKYVDAQLYPKTIQLTDFELNIAGKITVDKTNNLNVTLIPSNANTYKFSYSSGDESILTIDESGKITGIAEGTTSVTCVDSITNISKTLEVTVEQNSGLQGNLVMQLNGDSVQEDGTLRENITGIETDTSNTYINAAITDGDYILFKENASNVPFKSVEDEGIKAIDMVNSRNAFFIHSDAINNTLQKQASKTIVIDFKNKIQDGVEDKLNLYLSNSVVSENFSSVNNWANSTTVYVTQDKLTIERGESVGAVDIVKEVRYKLVLVLDAETENGKFNVYLDGTLISQTDYVKDDVKNGLLNVGNTEGSIMFKGYLYELSIYNKALTSQEVEAL